MKKSIASMLVTGLGLLLLVYSAARSIDFIGQTLPADQKILAFFGLAALDGGLCAWMLFFLGGAKGGWQRGIALLMVLIDFAGVVGMFTLDTLYRSAEAGMIIALTPDEIRAAVLALSGIIAANIGATVLTHLLDPDNLKKMAAEEAHDRIEAATLRLIGENANDLAAELAPRLAADWSQQTRARYSNLSRVIEGKLQDAPTPAESKPRQNGHARAYAAEVSSPDFLAGSEGQK